MPIALDQRLRRLEDVLARLPTVPPAPAYADNQEGIRGHNGRLDFPAAVARAEPDLSNHSGNPLVSDSELSSNVMDFDCDVPSEAERHSLVNSASASVVPSLVAAQGGPAGSTDVPEFASLPRCFLPTTREGISLLETYFHDFNTKIPLLSPLAIVTHLRDCYDGTAAGIPESWVLTYITFGIAHRMRAMSSSSTSEDSTMADFYMSKCLWTLAELLLGEPRLQLVQCLLGVAILLQTSDKSHRAASYTSIAMRMVQDLAYNEEQDDDESREKGYSFWIAFFMDNDLALSKSRPSSQRLADISIPLPGAADQDWWGPRDQSHSNTEGSINVFALHASLAVIQAEISEELFSARARKIGNIPAAYTDICSKLLYWRRSSELLTLDPLVLSQRSNRSDLIHLVFLEASYFRTVFHVYASQALGSFNTAIDVISPDSFRALAPIGLPACIEDAQRLLSWMVLMSYETLSW